MRILRHHRALEGHAQYPSLAPVYHQGGSQCGCTGETALYATSYSVCCSMDMIRSIRREGNTTHLQELVPDTVFARHNSSLLAPSEAGYCREKVSYFVVVLHQL